MKHHSPRSRRPGGCGGFTLIESLIASVVLAVAVVGIAGSLAASYQNSAREVAAAEATHLARQLMEEISARPFTIPLGSANNATGFSGGNTNRATYDDISDYHGYSDVSTSVPTLAGGSQSVGTAGPYTRSVTVTQGVLPVGQTPPAGYANDFKLVQVTVSWPQGRPVVLSKLFTHTKQSN